MKPIHAALCSFGMSVWYFHAPFCQSSSWFQLVWCLVKTQKSAKKNTRSHQNLRSLETMLADPAIELSDRHTQALPTTMNAKQALPRGVNISALKTFHCRLPQSPEIDRLAKERAETLLSIIPSLWQRRQNGKKDLIWRLVRSSLMRNNLWPLHTGLSYRNT